MSSVEIQTGQTRRCSPERLRGARRYRAALLLMALLLLLTAGLTAFLWLAPGALEVARADNATGAQKIGVFEDVTIGPSETWDNVVVVGGRATILGTVENNVVVVGGDVSIGPDARVGAGKDPDDTAIVVVFGDVQVESGASVSGETVDVGGGFSDWLATVGLGPDFDVWSARSIGGWVLLAVFLAMVAIIAVAIAPRQVAFVRERVRHHFFSSLGWGALGVLIAAPLITIVLIVTIVGLLLLLPWLGVVLPMMWLFGFVAVGAMVGRLIFGKRADHRGPLMLAAVLGLVLLSILWWIPIAGGIILFLLGLVGFGATYIAVWDWRRQVAHRRAAAHAMPESLDRPRY